MDKFGEVLKFLLDEGYLLKANSKYLLTGKFTREVAYRDNPVQAVAVVQQTMVPQIAQPLSNADQLKAFREAASIPHKVKAVNGTGEYTVNIVTEPTATAFAKLLRSGKFNYPDLVEATKLYYNNNRLARVTLSNYITKGVVEAVYEEYVQVKKKKGVSPTAPRRTEEGENMFEQGL